MGAPSGAGRAPGRSTSLGAFREALSTASTSLMLLHHQSSGTLCRLFRPGHWAHLTVWRADLADPGGDGPRGSLWLVREIVRRLPGWDAAHRQALLGAAALATYVLPWAVFGEREHVALVLVLPYVLLFAARESRATLPLRSAVVAGALAGFGFAIKPHFVVPWAALALAALWPRRGVGLSRRWEFVAASFTAAGCVLAVTVLEPGYVDYMRRFGFLYLPVRSAGPAVCRVDRGVEQVR